MLSMEWINPFIEQSRILTLQVLSTLKHLTNVLAHDVCDLRQVFVELLDVLW